MSSVWALKTLGEFCPFKYGKGLPERDRKPGVYGVFSSAGLVGSHEAAYVNSPGVVIGRKGTVGSVTYSSEPFWPIDTAFYVEDQPDIRDVRFTYYLLKTLNLHLMNTDSAVPGLNRDNAHALEVHVPPMSEQKSIADFLRHLDDRITLLGETNTTLEAIAQALFKSWFVDFDPVHAKMQGRAPEGMDEATATLFPDSFEESEFGDVPKGWTQSPLGKFCSVTIGGLWGKDDQEETDLVPAISLRGVDLEHLRAYGFAPDAPMRWVKGSAMERRRLTASQVLIASSGAGPCGRPLWAGGPLEEMYGLPVIFSNFVKRLECGTDVRALYVDRLLSAMRENAEIWNFINGTSIPNLDDKLLLDTKQVVMPPDAILEAFANVLKSIYNKLYGGQAVTLAALRDSLLPRLISGQISLPEVGQLEELLA